MERWDDFLGVMGLLLVFFINLVTLAPFRELCDRISKAEGRQAESQSRGAGDGGWNSFTQEHWLKLWRRDYRRYGDPSLTALGDRAFKWAAVGGGVTLVAVAVLVVRLSMRDP